MGKTDNSIEALANRIMAKISEEFQPTFESMQPHIVKEDQLTIVLKCHLYLEMLVDELIPILLPRPECFRNKGNLKFSAKVNLLNMLGVSKDIIQDLTLFNDHRNKFAHNFEYRVQEGHIAHFAHSRLVKNEWKVERQLVLVFMSLVGHIRKGIIIESMFPLYSFCCRNNRAYVEDELVKLLEVELSDYFEAGNSLMERLESAARNRQK